MSTILKSALGTRQTIEIDAEDGPVTVAVGHDRETSQDIVVPRADFLAAVATECDAIVIPRADLPKVWAEPERDYYRAGISEWTGATRTGMTADGLRQRALESLALAEHLDAHPPVDEAQVEALAHVLADSKGSPGSWRSWTDEARSLYVLGVRIEVTP